MAIQRLESAPKPTVIELEQSLVSLAVDSVAGRLLPYISERTDVALRYPQPYISSDLFVEVVEEIAASNPAVLPRQIATVAAESVGRWLADGAFIAPPRQPEWDVFKRDVWSRSAKELNPVLETFEADVLLGSFGKMREQPPVALPSSVMSVDSNWFRAQLEMHGYSHFSLLSGGEVEYNQDGAIMMLHDLLLGQGFTADYLEEIGFTGSLDADLVDRAMQQPIYTLIQQYPEPFRPWLMEQNFSGRPNQQEKSTALFRCMNLLGLPYWVESLPGNDVGTIELIHQGLQRGNDTFYDMAQEFGAVRVLWNATELLGIMNRWGTDVLVGNWAGGLLSLELGSNEERAWAALAHFITVLPEEDGIELVDRLRANLAI